MTRTVPLTKGYEAIVDDEDYDRIIAAKGRWHAKRGRKTFYAAHHIRKADGTWTTETLHRFIVPDLTEIDHVNGNGLDNRRSNLRSGLAGVNAINRSMFRSNTSGYRGVSFDRQASRWVAYITIDRKRTKVGKFLTAEEAARARDAAALRLHGPYAQLNFPLEVSK